MPSLTFHIKLWQRTVRLLTSKQKQILSWYPIFSCTVWNTHIINNLLRYMCAKNYQNRAWFGKVIAKNKTVQLFMFRCKFRQLLLRSRGWVLDPSIKLCFCSHSVNGLYGLYCSQLPFSLLLSTEPKSKRFRFHRYAPVIPTCPGKATLSPQAGRWTNLYVLWQSHDASDAISAVHS